MWFSLLVFGVAESVLWLKRRGVMTTHENNNEEVANAFACTFLTVANRDTDSNGAVGVI